mgnify:CR=1 FL=1
MKKVKDVLNDKRPLITPLLGADTADGLVQEIRDSLEQGADAIGLTLEHLPAELRTEPMLRRYIAAADGKPVYVTCYQRSDCIEESDDDRAETLLRALDCGAAIVDLRGDMFCPCDGEMTDDPVAVQKQIALIDRIHAAGGLALMSTHRFFEDGVHFLPRDEALRIALEQARRGADIAKIVTAANTEEELAECFETLLLLNKEVPVPVVFLCSGKLGLRHRVACGLIGEAMVFTKEKHHAQEGAMQLPIETIAGVFRTAGM